MLNAKSRLDVYVFTDGKYERPINTFGFNVPRVNDSEQASYASKEYILAFQLSTVVTLQMVDESNCLI